MLTGTVAKAEDVDVALRDAQAVGGLMIVNDLRVGGGQQVQLDAVILRLKQSLARGVVIPFVDTAAKGNATVEKIGTPFTGVLQTKRDSENLNTIIRAFKQEGLMECIAQPRMVTTSGTAGSFLVGCEHAVPVPAGLGQVGVQYEEFGTRLNYLPTVLDNGKIQLEVEPEISSLSKASDTVIPGRVTKRTHATLELEAGQTMVIGGLTEHTVQVTETKVPVLGDLPIIGSLFHSRESTDADEEIVILVTPTVIAPVPTGDQPLLAAPMMPVTKTPDVSPESVEHRLQQFGGRSGPTPPRTPCAAPCREGSTCGGCERTSAGMMRR